MTPRPSALVVAALLAAPALAAQDADLIGRWESLDRSRGGIGNTLAFANGGLMSQTIAAMVDFAYQVKGDTLIQTFVDESTGKREQHTIPFRIVGDTLVLQVDGHEQRKVRTTPADSGSLSIVGTWGYPHRTGDMAFDTYTADGALHFRLPIRTDPGTYEAASGKLVLHMSDRPEVRAGYAIQGSELALTLPGGRKLRYRRAVGTTR